MQFPPSKTSGAGVFLVAVDIGEVADVVGCFSGDHVGDHVGVPVVGGPGCLVIPISGNVLDMGSVETPGLVGVGYIGHIYGWGAGLLHPEQSLAVGHVVAWLKVQLLNKVVVLDGLPFVGPGGHSSACWHGDAGHLCGGGDHVDCVADWGIMVGLSGTSVGV